MKHYYKSSGLQMFFTGAAIAVMFIVILCADSLIEFIRLGKRTTHWMPLPDVPQR